MCYLHWKRRWRTLTVCRWHDFNIGNSKDKTIRKLLDQIKCKVAGYKINTQNALYHYTLAMIKQKINNLIN